ncbi:hypothetical protein [Bradyrhizobium sp. HKCCYLRH1065]|uniref:hypothetical protein n=1 Tax=unclassified Bradyrhizobium TaxID=2631580 RepID=UPI003EBCFD09
MRTGTAVKIMVLSIVFVASSVSLCVAEEPGKTRKVIEALIAQDPAVALAVMDAAAKHPAISENKTYSGELIKQRRLLASGIDFKWGKKSEGHEAEECAADLRRCAGRGVDMIFDKLGDAISSWCEKHPDKC